MAGYIGGKVAVSAPQQIETKHTITATASQTSIPNVGYTVGAVHVYQNGIRLVDGTDYTATNGSTVTLETGATEGDQIVIVSHGSFETSDTVSKASGGTFAAAMNYPGGAVTGNVTFGDSNKILMGAGSDLEIFHDGSNSFIKDVGTGYLNIATDGSDIRLQKTTGEYMGKFVPDGTAELYYDNAKKLATTATGIDVTGAITVGGAALGSGGMEFISSSGEISSAASVSFTGFDSSKYDNYVFYLNYVKPATDAQKLLAHASTNGGSSYDTTNGNYHTNGATDDTGFNIHRANDTGNATNEYGVVGVFRLFKPHASTYTTSYADTLVHNSSTLIYRGADGDYHGTAYQSTSEVNAIQFKFGSGNIASGEIVMFGIVNS